MSFFSRFAINVIPYNGLYHYTTIIIKSKTSDLSFHLQRKMNQNVLTTFSIVSIKYLENQKQFYLTNKSFVRDNVYLASEMNARDYEYSLFYVQTDSNQNQIKTTLDFGQKIVFRHKISNKYLSHSDEFEEQENDTTYKLRLSHTKHHFKILPCFQYQTKISSKIRFNQDVYLVTQISGAKTGYLSSKKTENPSIRNTILGINQHNSIGSSKFSFHNYYEREKDQQCYTFGSIVWISHIQSATFMASRTIKSKKQLTFQPIEYEKDLQSINGLWLIESHKFMEGGKIKFQSKFRLKNLSTGAYMSFSGNFKMNQNQRVYSIILQNNPTQKSEFIFRSLKGDESDIKKNSYLILRHDQSKLYIGCRKNLFFQDTEFHKPISTSQFSDEDLFKIIQLGENEDQALRFVLSLSQQLGDIEVQLNKQGGIQKLDEDKQIFLNIKNELEKLRKFDKLFQKIQGQTGEHIPILSEILVKYRGKIKRDGVNLDKTIQILKLLYEILVIICYENRKNQEQLFVYLPNFVQDIFFNLGAEHLMIQIFKNNYKNLWRASKTMATIKNKNIIQVTIQMVERFSNQKNNEYWQKLLKVMQFFFVLISDEDSSIDVNQRIISEQFFGPNQMFIKIFFGVKIINHRIKVEEQPGKFTQIDRIRNPMLISVVQQVFKLLSLLSYHRNFISKKSIHQFLSQCSENNIEILIAYLNMPISEKLCNSLYLLITNLYIDSSPRIDREKPLSVVNFALVSSPRSVQEEHEMSGKLKTQLLDKLVESYTSRPLMISNLLQFSAKMSMQPTLSHQQLALYKQQINEKLKKDFFSIDLLKSIVVMIRLESYTEAEIVDILKMLVNKLEQGNKLSPQTVKGIMKIISQISVFRRQVQLKKMSAYLKFKYRMQQLTINFETQSQYLLPFDRKLIPAVHYPKDINQSISSYNHEVDLLRQLWPNKKLSSLLLSKLVSKQNQMNMPYLEQIYNTLVSEAFHKKMFIELIIGSIVVTSEESATFEALFQLYKKLKHLTAISEYWLIKSGENQENMKSYVKYLIEVIHYLHQSYEGSSQNSGREIKIQNDYAGSIVKQLEVYVNRQLLIRNIGFHKLVLQLLQSNYFLLENEYSEEKKNNGENLKCSQIFSLCFQFIYGFIYNCNQTKQIIHKAWNILDKFQNLPEVGQTRVYRELYKNKVQYIREIKKNFIERIINKILKNPRSKGNEGNEFNPQYLRYLESIVKINGVCYKQNFEKLYRLLQKQTTFKKILFGVDQGDGKIELCLDMFQIKTDCVQIPFIYHIKILGLICDMADSLDSQSTIIKSKLRNIFNFNYLIRILASPDMYSHTGLQAKMRFFLKKQVMRIVQYFIERNDSIHFLHENIELLNLLQFYYRIFVERPKKVKEEFLNEALYLPYFAEYEEQAEYLENNERKYFQEEIVPFLQKISTILKKTQKSTINSKINQILQEYDDKKMVQFFEYRKLGKQIDKVSLRWLNFVDRDENNSPEQKFAKLSIVDLLRSAQSKKTLQNEKQQFSKLISDKMVQFIDVMIRLISMNMEEENKENESHKKFTKIYHRLVLVRQMLMVLPTKQKKEQQISFLLERGTIENFINFTIKLEFDYSKTIVRRIYHEILKIFIFIISNSPDSKPLKQIYRVVNEEQLCFRFWSHLSQSILIISEDTHIDKPLDQVNWCLGNIYLNGQTRDENIYEESLIFLEKLCQYNPFTKFLRYQPQYPSRDFLEILHHILNFILFKQGKDELIVTISTAEASQKVLNCITALMIGRNQTNQNFVVDSKLPQILTEVLKLEKLKRIKNRADQLSRERLIDQVIQFYDKNGIDLSRDLRHKISVLDYNHPYILNRLKYMLLRTIMQSVAGNERGVSKLKFTIPIQLIKINLIWVYQQFRSSKLQFKEELILKTLYQWQNIIDVEDLNGTFLMIGFYLYYLIEIFGEENENKNEDEDNSAEDKQKRKQKLVNKFFTTISQKDKKKQKLQKLNNEPFAEQMKMFFESYYEALQFFKTKTLSIEVNFHDQLTKVYFPKIPICEKMTQQIIQQFKTDAVRISQEEKIKSLLQFQQECFDRFSGQEKFINDVYSVFPFVAKWFGIFTQERLRLAALISCFVQTLLFLVENFLKPNFVFEETLLISPTSELQFIMFIMGVFNLVVAAHIFFALIFKKTPIMLSVLSDKQKQRDEKQREKFLNGRNSFIAKNMIPEVITSLMYIIFLLLSFIHPFFGSFVLFDVMNRLQLGRQIFKSVKETWFQLLMATILLIMFNYLFAIYIYIQFSTYYAPACQILFQCLLLLVDQSLKSGSGFYGTTNPIVEESIGLKFDLGFFSEMIYIIFAQKVMFQIFAGTIIDKFSQLREQAEQVQEDQNTNCYICGQERFVIDFELEGFQPHVQQTHNPIYYVFYLFYLQKQNPRQYGVIQKFVNDCQHRKKKYWIPNETSILKQQKQRQKEKQNEQNEELRLKEYIEKKTKQLKQVRTKNAMIIGELKMENSRSKT